MNYRKILSVVLLTGAIVFVGSQVLSQDHTDQSGGQPQMTAEQLAEMQAWMKIATPGENHKHLQVLVGHWETVTKIWMGGPGSPAMESKGTSQNRWVLGGRFVQQEYKGEFMGQPYEGLGMTGYDNYKNMYIASWADTTGTHLLTSRGQRDPSGKVFTFYGEMDEPSLNVSGRIVKYVTRIINENKHVFEIIDLHAGDNYKVMEITYTRK